MGSTELKSGHGRGRVPLSIFVLPYFIGFIRGLLSVWPLFIIKDVMKDPGTATRRGTGDEAWEGSEHGSSVPWSWGTPPS